MCQDYLLTKKCSEFHRTGKCIRSHSLFTQHNQRIIRDTLNISPGDRDAFETVSEYVQKSRPLMRSSIRTDHRPLESSSKEVKLMDWTSLKIFSLE